MRILNLFLKEPLPGQVRGRLAESLGGEKAVLIYRAMVRILLQQLSGLEHCHLRISYTPDDGEEAMRFWILPEIIDDPSIDLDPHLISFAPQGPGKIHTRLAHAAERAFQEGFRKVAFIGSECIEVSSRWIHAAFAQLNDEYDVVLGPTTDGGQHLLVVQRHLPALFKDPSWSGPAFRRTTEQAAKHGISLFTLPALPAIRTEDDYQAALTGPLGPRFKKVTDKLEKKL